jgi:hypothetical protein
MKQEERKSAPQIESNEDAGQFWLEHDSVDFVDWDAAARPNQNRTTQLVPVAIPTEEYSRLAKLAATKHRSLGELASQIFQKSLRDFFAHGS